MSGACARWDVVVVGGGPAGSSAALATLRARPDARVLVLDAADFPRDKVCGDGVAPHALDVLADLGVDLGDLVAGSEPVTSLRLRSPAGVEVARPFARPAYVIPRKVFDARLLAAAKAAGAVVCRHRVRDVRRTGAGVTVDGEVHAGCVIGADGAESVVRRAIAAHRPPVGTVAVALRGYVPSGAWPSREQLLTMTRAHWPAYAWVFPIGDGTANVGYGELLRGRAPTRAQLTDRLHGLLPGLGEVGELRGHRLPLTTGRPAFGHGRVLLAGDAASLVNPLTGEGIFYAVLSGALAGRAALAADPGAEYDAALRGALAAHLRTTDLLARLTRRTAVLDAGVEAARVSRHAFDRLVDIGLGAGTADLRSVAVAAGAALARTVRSAGAGASRRTLSR